MAIVYEPLIKSAWWFKDVTNNEFIEFKSLPKETLIKKRFSHYETQFNLVLIGDIKKYYRICPDANIAEEISAYKTSREERPTKFDLRFYLFLLNENKELIKRNYIEIAKILLMQKYIDRRAYGLIRKTLNRLYEMFKDLGYLLDYKIDQKGITKKIDIFYLNPTKFYKSKRLKNGNQMVYA